MGVVTSGLPGSHFPAWDITLPVGWGESDWGPSISGLAQSLQSVSGGQVEEGSSHLVTLTRDVTSATGSCGETGNLKDSQAPGQLGNPLQRKQEDSVFMFFI